MTTEPIELAYYLLVYVLRNLASTEVLGFLCS